MFGVGPKKNNFQLNNTTQETREKNYKKHSNLDTCVNIYYSIGKC